MIGQACCSAVEAGERLLSARSKAGSTRRTGLARISTLSSWIGPSALLVLLPKCPMCLAAYLALAGIGVSTAAAAGVRVGVIVLCLSILAYRLARAGVRMTTSNPSNRSSLPY
jgi:hypothetical protein